MGSCLQIRLLEMANSTLNLRKPSPAANDNDTSESNDKRFRKAPKFMHSHLIQKLLQKTATMQRMTSISHSLSLTVPVQSELMPLMEKCSIPQKILVQRQFKLLIGLINSLINYQRTKRSCKKIFQPVQSKKYI